MIEIPDDGSSGISEALSEALRTAEAEHWRRVEEIIRRYRQGPPAVSRSDEKKSPRGT